MAGKLTLVAAGGLAGAVVLLAVGAGLSGQGWRGMRHLWAMSSACGATASTARQVTFPLAGNDTLTIALPASVRYQPGGKAEIVVTGDSAFLGHVRLEGDRLDFDCDPGWFTSKLDVTVSGPAIKDWSLLGRGDLTLSQIDQPQLRLDIRGSGSVAATGTVDSVDLDIAGSGEARLKQLTAKSARIDIRGSGDAEVTAQTDADVSISGSGNVELSGHPVLRRSEIRGSGRITQVP
jgi:hypothetical protein